MQNHDDFTRVWDVNLKANKQKPTDTGGRLEGRGEGEGGNGRGREGMGGGSALGTEGELRPGDRRCINTRGCVSETYDVC